jgi:hypothetical protein
MVSALLSVVGHNYSLILNSKAVEEQQPVRYCFILNCQLLALAGIVLLVIIIGEILAGHKFNKKLIPQL